MVELMCYNNKNCLNGGRCVEVVSSHSYKCECPANFAGKHCENENS